MLLTENTRLRTGEVLEQIRANPLPQTGRFRLMTEEVEAGNKEIKATLD